MKNIIGIIIGTLFCTQAFATVVTFDNFVHNNTSPTEQIDWLVTIDDEGAAGQFNFDISIASGSASVGDIRGFGFNTSAIDYGPSILDNIIAGSAMAGGSPVMLSECSGACNFNGGLPSIFFTTQVGDTGSSAGLITDFLFSIDGGGTGMLESDTFTLVALRAQSVGPAPTGGFGISKDYSETSSTDSPLPLVPEPSTLALLGLGLAGVGFSGRKAA